MFTKQRNVANALVEKLKRHYFLHKFEGITSSKELFVTTDFLLGKDKNMALPSGSEKELCERFLDFFNQKIFTIRTELDSQQDSSVDFSSFDGLIFDTFEEVTDVEIIKVLKSSSPKTCDLDPIPTCLLLDCVENVAPFITRIMNESLTKGIVPDCYKHAIIKPLLKKSSLNENDFNNFRPVSNLAFLSKLLEKLVLRQLSKHMKHNELEEIYQSAYKAFHSTETALLKVTSDVLEQLDNKKVCFLILLDLSAAFDTIDHGILLKRLRVTFGLSGTVLEWFQSYLSGRFQSVVVGGEKSTSSPLTLGVPQGSVLGPVLFTIYTQPLAEILTKHGMKYHLYADDTQIYVSGTRDEIPEMSYRISCCVTDVKAWMTCNKLKLNDDKTELLLIDKDGYASHDTAVDINGHLINCTK